MAEYAVKDQVNLDAEILVVGEAPGREEMAGGLPFLGDSGYKLKDWWRHAGINRDDLYITNVLRTIPSAPGGNITEACKRDSKFVGQIRDVEYLRLRRIADELPNLRVIACVGNYATRAFTKYGNVQWDTKAPGITSVRGSVYQVEGCVKRRAVAVIPTIHPAAVMRQPNWERRCINDWKKAVRIARDGWSRPERDHLIFPTIDEIVAWRDAVQANDVVSFDIETWGDGIKCVGFAKDERQSIVIPTELWAWEKIEGKQSRAKQSLQKAWYLIKEILESDVDKGAQNGMFDCWWLAQPEYGIRVNGYHWDTMAMHHALVPNESHSLEFLASIYTDEPYWKDEAKEADAITKIARQGMERLYVYNGLDVTVAWEIFAKLYDLLDEQKMLPFYLRHYADMVPSLLRLMQTGAPVNRELVLDSRRTYLARALQLRDEASRLAGRPLFHFNTTTLEDAIMAEYFVNGPGGKLLSVADRRQWLQQFQDSTKTLKSGKVKKLWTDDVVNKKWEELQNKGISDTILNKVLYEEWECPVGKFTETGRTKADNIALKTLQNTVRDRKRGAFIGHRDDIIKLVELTLDHRRQRKLATFVDPTRLDADDRIRCTYKFTTKSGRLASASNPKGTGTNLQNQDRDIRQIYVASPGRVLLECDLSQAEARVVKACTGDPRMIELARRLPTEGDEHVENAVLIFSALQEKQLTPEDITKDMRQLGKRVVHASNYDMGKNRLSEILLKEGYTMTPQECGRLIKAYREAFPAIDEYQAVVRRAILRERALYTSWGRRVSFEGFRMDDELYKFGYSYVPQSEIGDLLNQYGLQRLDHYLYYENLAGRKHSDIILQVHDSVVVDAAPEDVFIIMEFLAAQLEQPRRYGQCFGYNVELSIPVEYKIGLNWAKGKEWKYLPDQGEVETYVEELLNES